MKTETIMDFTDRIISYESGNMSLEDCIDLFQDLLDTGMIRHLQGHYGRTAQELLNCGLIHPPAKEA